MPAPAIWPCFKHISHFNTCTNISAAILTNNYNMYKISGIFMVYVMLSVHVMNVLSQYIYCGSTQYGDLGPCDEDSYYIDGLSEYSSIKRNSYSILEPSFGRNIDKQQHHVQNIDHGICFTICACSECIVPRCPLWINSIWPDDDIWWRGLLLYRWFIRIQFHQYQIRYIKHWHNIGFIWFKRSLPCFLFTWSSFEIRT